MNHICNISNIYICPDTKYDVMKQFSKIMKEFLHFMGASVLAENTLLQESGNLAQFILLESPPPQKYFLM